MSDKFGDLTIGAFAGAAEVSVETVRFYQRRGLLTEPEKPFGRIRRYGTSDVARVRFIKASQRLGFSLDEVAGLLSLDDGAHCNEARALAEAKLLSVRGKLTDLRRIEKALAALVRECCATTGAVSCPLISTLQQE
jgi:MerR family mercuric resistance operon transcriptional regulator